MTEGVQLEFLSPPPLSLSPPPSAASRESHLPAIREFVPALLSRNIIRRISRPQPLFFSSLFIVPKKDGPNRLIIDLSILNTYLIVPKFKMERVSSIAAGIVEPMWGVTIDLKDAFYHVPVAWHFHRFLAFEVDGQVYVFQFLPFGLSIAPWAFSRITKPIKAHLHLLLYHFHTYLDDFFLMATSRPVLLERLSYVLSLLDRLGITVNHPKSNLVPCRTLDYLGVTFHLDSLQLSLPPAKAQQIMSLCSETSLLPLCSRRHLESLVGLLNFASYFLPLGRLRLRPVMAWMNLRTSVHTRDLPVPLDVDLRKCLRVWTDPLFLSSRVSMSPPVPSLQLMTDASMSGWGGVLVPHSISGTWPEHLKGSSINFLELMAVFLSVQHFLPLLRSECVQVLTDNTTAIACIHNQGTQRSPKLLALTTSLLEFCHLHSIRLSMKHICGTLNVLADKHSRALPISTEWSLDLQTFRWLCSLSVPPQVDLFATRENHLLPAYVSPCPDPGALEVNAMSLSWDEWESIYLFPPVQLLSKVVPRLARFPGRGILVAPFYPQASWLPLLLSRAPRPRPLPSDHSLSQVISSGRVFHPNPSVYCLHAWVL